MSVHYMVLRGTTGLVADANRHFLSLNGDQKVLCRHLGNRIRRRFLLTAESVESRNADHATGVAQPL